MESVRLEKEQFETAGKDELQFINSFFILFRTAHYVEASNATYQTQSARFYVNFRRLVDEHGRISVKVIEGRIFVRDKMVKFDSDGMVRAREIIDTWRHLGIGGIVLDDSLDNRRIDKFVYLIAKLERSKLGMEEVSERLT